MALIEDARIEEHPVADYIRTDRLPWIFCSGCLIGSEIQIVARSIKTLVDKGAMKRENVMVVSGIGCSGRASGYFNLDAFHTTHGRSIPFASGVKLANPNLKVIVFSGDGDLFAIGGNHIIHAARRNIDLTVITINNSIYGMTGGQASPTTPLGDYFTQSTPWGNYAEIPFNMVSLMASSGATFVARYTSLHTKEAFEGVQKALLHKGFSFIEFITPCPTYFGKSTNVKTGLEMMKKLQSISRIKDGSSPFEATCDLEREIICGEFKVPSRPEYTASYENLRKHVLEQKGSDAGGSEE